MNQEPIRWLYGLQQFGIKLGLQGIRELLDRLGLPERGYPSALVAGTNGKGSVAAMLDAMLLASGRRSGLYTSPHLVWPNERIRVAGDDLDTPELCGCLASVRRVAEAACADGTLPAHPSFFEVMTAAALLAFRQSGVDAAVLEVGLGGRLDATNAVPARVATIVSIDLDHTDRLGTSIEQIASEKAGIVKPGRPLVSGVAQDEATAVIRRACEDARATFVDARRECSVLPGADGSFDLETGQAAYRGLRISLEGRHQIENARVAVVTLEMLAPDLGLRVDPDRVRSGLAAVRWPGRLQWIPGHPRLLLDGAHNPAGAVVLAEYLRQLEGPKPVLLFGSLEGKDYAGILARLAGEVEAVVVTRPPVDRAADPRELARATPATVARVEIVEEPGRALERVRDLVEPGGFVLVAGSLYLVGTVLGMLEGEDAPGPVPM